MPRSASTKKNPEHEAYELAARITVYGQSLSEAAAAMGIRAQRAGQIAKDERYGRFAAMMQARLEEARELDLNDAVKMIRKTMFPNALARLDRIVVAEKENKVALRAIENVLDRGGLPRTQREEHDVKITLDQETVERLSIAASKHADLMRTIELRSTEWSYAYQKPGGGERGGAPTATPGDGKAKLPFHGKGDRVQRPDRHLPRGDGGVDSEAVESEAGFSPARALEDLNLDDRK